VSRQPRTHQQAESYLIALDFDQVDAAASEVERELQVRQRCYPRWVDEGKISRIDAKDRFERQQKALEILQAVLDSKAAPPA
jgi:hypothetical protein